MFTWGAISPPQELPSRPFAVGTFFHPEPPPPFLTQSPLFIFSSHTGRIVPPRFSQYFIIHAIKQRGRGNLFQREVLFFDTQGIKSWLK